MFISQFQKFTRFLLAITLGSLVAACSGGERESDIAASEGILLFGNGSEPKGLDPHLVTGVPENHIISSLIEGLIAYHPTDDLVPAPGMAESWESNDDYTVWTFKLRDDAAWSNGDPVLASDFAYSWERILTPMLGSEYAPMLYVIKGAQAFHAGETEDFSTVGVNAIDDKTLEVTLAGPTPYFLNMLKHYSFFPVNPRAVEENGGMTDRQSGWSTLENYVGNGPFKLKSWVTNQVIEVERNPTYWDAENVKLNGIRFFPVENGATEETMFRSGRLHITSIVPPDKIPSLKESVPDQLMIEPYLGSYFYRVNVTRPPFDNVKVRQALAVSFDKELLVEKVTKGGQNAATGYVPNGIPGYATSTTVQYDPELGKKLLAEAGYADGVGFPKTEILINTSESHRKIAEAMQAMWKDNLGIDVGIYNQEWKVYLDSQSSLDYDLSRSGWIGDYVHASTFLEMFTTGNGNNDTGWSSAQYDALIAKAQLAGSEEERSQVLSEAEEILLAELPVIPIYWYTRVYMKDPQLKGWEPKVLDNRPYKHVYFEAN
ncbi:MAG: peptide ABC transporter substrate-binding protein [Erythrobacter sp.]